MSTPRNSVFFSEQALKMAIALTEKAPTAIDLRAFLLCMAFTAHSGPPAARQTERSGG
jgi:hypothetical protein